LFYDVSFYYWLQHVHPYGSEYLSASGALKVPNGHDSFSVAFASGGSTGKMKFVYRSAWEGKLMCLILACIWEGKYGSLYYFLITYFLD
jgi:hypothetical protein